MRLAISGYIGGTRDLMARSPALAGMANETNKASATVCISRIPVRRNPWEQGLLNTKFMDSSFGAFNLSKEVIGAGKSLH
jgi:hypothetical protein